MPGTRLRQRIDCAGSDWARGAGQLVASDLDLTFAAGLRHLTPASKALEHVVSALEAARRASFHRTGYDLCIQ